MNDQQKPIDQLFEEQKRSDIFSAIAAGVLAFFGAIAIQLLISK